MCQHQSQVSWQKKVWELILSNIPRSIKVTRENAQCWQRATLKYEKSCSPVLCCVFLKRWETHSPNLKTHCTTLWHMLRLFFFSFWLFLLIPLVTNYLSSISHPVKNIPVFHDTRVESYFRENKKLKGIALRNFKLSGSWGEVKCNYTNLNCILNADCG